MCERKVKISNGSSVSATYSKSPWDRATPKKKLSAQIFVSGAWRWLRKWPQSNISSNPTVMAIEIAIGEWYAIC